MVAACTRTGINSQPEPAGSRAGSCDVICRWEFFLSFSPPSLIYPICCEAREIFSAATVSGISNLTLLSKRKDCQIKFCRRSLFSQLARDCLTWPSLSLADRKAEAGEIFSLASRCRDLRIDFSPQNITFPCDLLSC